MYMAPYPIDMVSCTFMVRVRVRGRVRVRVRVRVTELGSFRFQSVYTIG